MLACAPWTLVLASALPAPAAIARFSGCAVQEVFWQIDMDKSDASALPAPAAMARFSCRAVQEVFWQIDKDKSGTLEPTELRNALLQLGIPVPGEADFQALFDASDINKHGHIDYVEFVATMLDSDRVARWAAVNWLVCLNRRHLPARHSAGDVWKVLSGLCPAWVSLSGCGKRRSQAAGDRTELPPSQCNPGESTGHTCWQHVCRTAKGASCSTQPTTLALLALKQPLNWGGQGGNSHLCCLLPTAVTM